MEAEYLDHLGSDLTVVDAARVSFDKKSAWVTDAEGNKTLAEKDIKLLRYLANNGHWTPFGHPQVSIRETVPIFVARQRFKHTIGFVYNEVSRRYVDDEPRFYEPNVWRGKASDNKQGSYGVVGNAKTTFFLNSQDHREAIYYSEYLDYCAAFYRAMLKRGVAPEQARMVLPQSMYTSYHVTGSLAAWARFYKLRTDPHAQLEIQDLATQVWDIIEPFFPYSWSLLTTGTL